MLRGRFGDTSGRPYLKGRLLIPRLAVTSDISFLVDTGAGSTILSPADGRKMRLDYETLDEAPGGSVGIGGKSKIYPEDAFIAFMQVDGPLIIYKCELGIMEPKEETLILSSLLGRDLLRYWRMEYNQLSGHLIFDTLGGTGSHSVYA